MSEIDIDWLIKILPKLIRENDQVKGAILTALTGVVATRDDIKDLIKEMDKRFETMDKRFETMHKEMDKRFEAMDKRFEIMQKEMNSQFTHVFQRLDEISIGADVSFELFCKNMIKFLLKAENIELPYIESGRHFQDLDRSVFQDTTDIEIDLFCPNPPVIGEVTYKLTNISKMEKFVRKIAFMEKNIFKTSPQKFFCALEISANIYSDVLTLARKHQIEVISKEVKA
ncbi:MAG: hypothetical protein ACTSYI_02215 [Promethearchaeota archaeon]